MTWRMNGLVAAAGTLVVLTFWYLERSTLPREDTIYEATPADWMFYRIKHEDLAGQVRRMVRRMVELQEPTEKLVESFNQETDLLEKRSIDGSTADDLVFGAFPPVVAAAAKYEADVAQEHPATILLPQNLLDLDQRATSRASLIRLRAYLASYRLSLSQNPEPRILICGNDRAAVADAMSRRFYRSQVDLEAQRFDEIEALLDMMDRTWEANLDGDTMIFPTVRQQEDYQRSLSRIQRLGALRTTRERVLQQRLEKKPDGGRVTTPPGIWDFLHNYGISVRLDREQIKINGRSIVLPVEKAKLIAALGKPREIQGDPARSVWDQWGIAAVDNAGTTQIHTLIIALRPRPTRWWPTKMVGGRLTLLGIAVDEHSTPWSLNRKLGGQEFVGDESGNEWTLSLEGYTVKTTFDLDGTIDSLTIHSLPPHP